ncbi:hypothetical protein FBU59_002288 [Linderina macrospora]|uniref:Uncharacterized protein n=1 Tax=Linderina macrospora TaxID=4868 RepID=A0ACC1JBJ6_9FUNG|nr:hypothetical protein FBU59_002288 [Linderina macrospora]
MHSVRLPDELVLRVILTYDRNSRTAIAHTMRSQTKELQPLTAISQQWRRLALPHFYKRAFVSIDDSTTTQQPYTESNLRLLLDTAHDDLAKELVVQITYPLIPLADVQRIMAEQGFDQTAWLSVHRLVFSNEPRDFSWTDEYFGPEELVGFNNFLALGLPSLREINYTDLYCQFMYNSFPVSSLINEHIGGPTPLRSLQTMSDIPPALRHYQGRPIAIQKLQLHGVNFPGALKVPKLLASSLVDLKLAYVDANTLWDMFASDPGSDELVFSRLRKLEFVFHWQSTMRGAHPVYFADGLNDDGQDDSDSADDSDSYIESNGQRDDGSRALAPQSYMRSAVLGRPQFPVLQSLKVRRFPGNLQHFLTLFPREQLRELVLAGLKRELPTRWDLAHFRSLQQLSLCYVDTIEPGNEPAIESSLRRLFAAIPTPLRELSLSMLVQTPHLNIPLVAPLQASLTSLELLVDLHVEVVVRVLAQLPGLRSLTTQGIIVDPLVSIAQLVAKFKGTVGADFVSTNDSLRVLEVPFIVVSTANEDNPRRQVQEQVERYRDLLFSLVPRLPNVGLMMVTSDCVKAVRKSISTTLAAKVVPEPVASQFRQLKVLPWGRADLE